MWKSDWKMVKWRFACLHNAVYGKEENPKSKVMIYKINKNSSYDIKFLLNFS